MNINIIKIADLFAGIGGFHLAFHRQGAECAFAVEWNKYARQTYEANYTPISPSLFENNLFFEDITKLKIEELPEFDILCAGFPCQSFSPIGDLRGFAEQKDLKGNMFFEILRILRAKRPEAFFLENVKNIIGHDGGRTFKIIKDLLQNSGYSFHYHVAQGCDYGIPQLRARTYMVGFRDETTAESNFHFPEKIPLKFTMDDVFEGKCNRQIGFAVLTNYANKAVGIKYNWENYIVDGQPRRVTSKEAKKMMGYPNDFKFPVSEAQAIKQLGNTVIVPLIEAHAQNIINYIKERRLQGNYKHVHPYIQYMLQPKMSA